MKRALVLLLVLTGCHFALIDHVEIAPSVFPKKLLLPDTLPQCRPDTTRQT